MLVSRDRAHVGAEQEGEEGTEVTAFKPQRPLLPGQALGVTTAREPKPTTTPRSPDGLLPGAGRPSLGPQAPAGLPRACTALSAQQAGQQPAWAWARRPQRKPGEGAAWGLRGASTGGIGSAQVSVNSNEGLTSSLPEIVSGK